VVQPGAGNGQLPGGDGQLSGGVQGQRAPRGCTGLSSTATLAIEYWTV
jgi:hypothetical protein